MPGLEIIDLAQGVKPAQDLLNAIGEGEWQQALDALVDGGQIVAESLAGTIAFTVVGGGLTVAGAPLLISLPIAIAAAAGAGELVEQFLEQYYPEDPFIEPDQQNESPFVLIAV